MKSPLNAPFMHRYRDGALSEHEEAAPDCTGTLVEKAVAAGEKVRIEATCSHCYRGWGWNISRAVAALEGLIVKEDD